MEYLLYEGWKDGGCPRHQSDARRVRSRLGTGAPPAPPESTAASARWSVYARRLIRSLPCRHRASGPSRRILGRKDLAWKTGRRSVRGLRARGCASRVRHCGRRRSRCPEMGTTGASSARSCRRRRPFRSRGASPQDKDTAVRVRCSFLMSARSSARRAAGFRDARPTVVLRAPRDATRRDGMPTDGPLTVVASRVVSRRRRFLILIAAVCTVVVLMINVYILVGAFSWAASHLACSPRAAPRRSSRASTLPRPPRPRMTPVLGRMRRAR